MKWDDAVVERLHGSAYTIKNVMGHMRKSKYLTFAWEEMADLEIARQLAFESPKLRIVARMAAEVAVLLDEKMLVWAQYPIKVLFITKFLQAMNINAVAYQARMSATERTKVIDDFNSPDTRARVMVLTNGIGGFGLNLQKCAHFMLIVTEPLSIPRYLQMAFRIRRPGQPYQQNVVHVCGDDTYDSEFREKNVAKAIPHFAAIAIPTAQVKWKSNGVSQKQLIKNLPNQYTGYKTSGDCNGIEESS